MSIPEPSERADISTLLEHLQLHGDRLSDARREIGGGINWYLYDILGNLPHIDALLQGEYRDLARLAGGWPVADIGAADGDLASSLEHEWRWQVDIVDTAHSNMNGLAGARALRDHLGSGVTIEDIDLDSQFRLPRERYGLVFLLGILYHLQNPYYVLRQLARQADHCLLSTRVARYTGPLSGGRRLRVGRSGQIRIAELPVAYLVNPDETNNDPTNYWIFSPFGLERIVARTGWTILAQHHAGDLTASDPASAEHDEQVFMLLRSS